MATFPIIPVDLVQTVLPPWTRAVACGVSVLPEVKLPAQHILLLPLPDAPPVSVDALLLGPHDLPDQAAGLGPIFQTLRPGGTAILAVDRGRFARRELETLLAATGLGLAGSRSSQRADIARLVIVENLGGKTERPPLRLSVVLGGDLREREPLTALAAEWLAFLNNQFRPEGTEIIALRDGPADEITNLRGGEVEYREIGHYRPFGPVVSAHTALRFARGRWILFDGSAGKVPPESFLDLLGPLLEQADVRPSLVAGLASEGDRTTPPPKPPWQGGPLLRPFLRERRAAVRRLMLGAGEPVADFFLLDFELARSLQPNALARVRPRSRRLLLPRVRRDRLRELPIRRRLPPPEQPGIFRSAWWSLFGA